MYNVFIVHSCFLCYKKTANEIGLHIERIFIYNEYIYFVILVTSTQDFISRIKINKTKYS